MNIFIDRIFRLPRIWSNKELKKFSHLFSGKIVNVSGWLDIDKEGGNYEQYFKNRTSYTITNFKTEARGFQGLKNEIFLDLEKELSDELIRTFDVVFNHTVLEHIYDFKKAFANLCEMSNDIVILVVPFLQQYHSSYGDYWRFTPLAIKELFKEHGFEPLYMNFNSNKFSSVYIFAIASRNPEKWKNIIKWEFTVKDKNSSAAERTIGSLAIPSWIANPTSFINYRLIKPLKKFWR